MAGSETRRIKTIRTATSVVDIHDDFVVKTLIHKSDKERLWAEATALKVLGECEVSPRLIEQGQRDGQDFVKMERVHGATLQEAHFPKNQNVDGIAFSVIHNLATIHENDLLHRDFKPSNLIVEDHGNVRVIDFGCSTSSTVDEKEPKQFMYSTPCVIPPEIHMGRSRWTKVGEVFSLGVVLYHLYSGKHPFGNGKSEEIAERACFHDPESIDHPVWPIIHNCLIKNPAKRYQSANEVLGELIFYQSGQEVEYRVEPKTSFSSAALNFVANNFLWTMTVVPLVAFLAIYGLIGNRNVGEIEAFSLISEKPPSLMSPLEKMRYYQVYGKVPIKIEHKEKGWITHLISARSKESLTIKDNEIHIIKEGKYFVTFENVHGAREPIETIRIIRGLGPDRFPVQLKAGEKELGTTMKVSALTSKRDNNGILEFVRVCGYQGQVNNSKYKIIKPYVKTEKRVPYGVVMDCLEQTDFRLPTYNELVDLGIKNPTEYLHLEMASIGNRGKLHLMKRSVKAKHSIRWIHKRR